MGINGESFESGIKIGGNSIESMVAVLSLNTNVVMIG